MNRAHRMDQRKRGTTKMKKSIVAISVLVVAMMSLASVTFAASVIKSPAEIVSGQLDAFQQQRLDAYKASLAFPVANQKMTQAQADTLYANMQLRVDACDGTGIGAGNGAGMGKGTGTGICGGTGAGAGLGQGSGTGTSTGRGGMGMGRTGR